MFRLRWLQVGGGTRGKPPRDRSHRKAWPALGLVACLALLQSGCQSGPFSNCGTGCGSGLFSSCGFFGRVSSRVFNRNRGADCCEPGGVVSGAPVEYAAPATVVGAPASVGATMVPSYPGPAGSLPPPSTVPPVPPEPSDLRPADPLPKSRLDPPPTNGASNSPSSKTSYQTRRTDSGSRLARRPVTLPRTQVSTPEPTSRSAQALSRSRTGNSSQSDSQDPLDHLPPLDLPGEVTRSSATPPVPPAADRGIKPGDSANKKPDVRREAPAPAADDLDLTSTVTPAGSSNTSSASVGPGITRFVAVDLKLAGGSAPSNDGLKWLADKGYRTILDLRESSEVPPSFIAQVTGMGLRYVALPIGLKSIDRDHVERFNFEMAAGEARPLFFFDADGTRAGALWYIRRIANDRVDRQIARREAQELGLIDTSFWSAATNYVDKLATPQPTATSPAAGPGSTQSAMSLGGAGTDQSSAATPGISSGGVAPPKSQDSNSASVKVGPIESAQSGAPGEVPGQPVSAQADTTGLAGSLAWRPFAAMVLTGLSLPLAYWSRTLPTAVLSKARASLPGPAHRPKSLPGESGA